MANRKPITIAKAASDFVREPLISPFGFKGGYLTGTWQAVAYLESAAGGIGLGLGTQSTLWSDAGVFTAHGEAAGNALMYLVLDHALGLVRGRSFRHPVELLDEVLPEVVRYARHITERPDLRLTFALNALIALDNAVWMLYGRENGCRTFDDLAGPEYRPALAHRHPLLASIPLISYGVSLDAVRRLAENGHFFLKIKIGSDPDRDGSRDKMLEWDQARLSAIHQAVGRLETEHTTTGRTAYYLDANGRYDGKDRLRRLLDHARKIGAFEQIVIVEEPFPEHETIDVSDLGVTVAADESAHSDAHARERIQMGYRAIALKPIAKTMSMSLKIAKLAVEAAVPCFCADLTVIPILVDWNKCVAARLAPLPGLRIGAFETNGDQNYRNWKRMMGYHPCAGAEWLVPQKGLFHLTDDFYAKAGGILEPSAHYLQLVKPAD